MPHPSDPDGVVGAQLASPRTRMVWKWLRWTRLPLTLAMLAVAAITVAVDVGTAWADISLGHLGRVPISPALPLGLLLAGMVGLRRLGLDHANIRAWREFLLVGGFVLVFGVWRYSMYVHGTREALGLILAALGEELVYRLAVLILVGAGTAKLLGRNWRNAEDWGVVPGVVALLAAGLVFTLLPGHVAQMSDALHALPFACLGVVLGYAVLRTGALFPAAVVHAVLNLATIAAIAGTISLELRTTLAAVALVALVLGTTVAGMRLGILKRVVLDPAKVSKSGHQHEQAPARGIHVTDSVRVVGFDHVVLNVGDIELALAFYIEELGLAPVRVEEWRRAEAPFPSARVNETTIIDFVQVPATADRHENMNHLCLVVEPVDFEALAGTGRFEVVDGPGIRFGAQGNATSLYVRDPDGNTVELRHH